jgi:hypothetical protein
MLRTVIACFGALLLTGCGITGNYRQDPGYAKFDGLTSLAGKREIGLSFGTLPLALARLVIDDEPEIESILRDLRAVRVYVYDSLEVTERVEREVSAVREGLIGDGWAAIATVRDGDERVAVLLRPDADGGRTHGLAVIVQDSRELVLVNLIGNVRVDQFAKYMAELKVPVPTIDFGQEALRAEVPH